MKHGSHFAGLGLAAASLALLSVRFFLAASTGLTDDEAYYRLWSLALAPSYLDHPPMVAVLIRIGRVIAGDSELGVRLTAPVMLAAGGLLLARIGTLAAGAEAAHHAGWFYLCMPLLAVGGVVFTPDLPSVLFFGLVVWSLLELDRSQNANWWLVTGACAGLGLLSKYTNLFAGATILLWLLAVPENRKWFKSWQLWAGGALAGLLFFPVIAWNAAHNWASFAKQFGRVYRDDGLGVKYLIEMAGGYLALASPPIALLSGWGLFRIVRRAAATKASTDVLISASILPLLAYFVVHALHARVQANWLAPIYPMLALCAAVATIECMAPTLRTQVSVAARCLGLSLVAVIYAHALHPLFSFRKDPTAQMRGWPELAASAEILLKSNGGAWIATSSYATTAQLSFAFKGRIPVFELDAPIRYENLPAAGDQLLAPSGLYVDLERRENARLLEACFAHVRRLVSMTPSTAAPERESYVVYSVSGFTGTCSPPGGFRFEIPARSSL